MQKGDLPYTFGFNFHLSHLLARTPKIDHPCVPCPKRGPLGSRNEGTALLSREPGKTQRNLASDCLQINFSLTRPTRNARVPRVLKCGRFSISASAAPPVGEGGGLFALRERCDESNDTNQPGSGKLQRFNPFKVPGRQRKAKQNNRQRRKAQTHTLRTGDNEFSHRIDRMRSEFSSGTREGKIKFNIS